MIVDTLLLLSGLVVWIGCIGFARLRTPYDRLHCAAFVAVTAGPLVVLTAFFADGASDRTWKILLMVILLMVNGAALSHATSRAVAWRGMSGEKS